MRVISAAWQRGIALGVLLVGAGVPLGAQPASPNPLGQPLLDAAGQLRDDAFIRIPLRSEDERYADIEGDHLKAMLLEVDLISLADRDAGTVFWGRNVGTAGHVATQDWVEGRFRRYGLDHIYRQSFDLNPVWHPTAWELTFASGSQTFTLESARPPQDAESTPPEGLEFDLVWVGGGSDADYLGRDVVGKAVLIQDIPRPGTLRHSSRYEGSVARAFEKGADARRAVRDADLGAAGAAREAVWPAERPGLLRSVARFSGSGRGPSFHPSGTPADAALGTRRGDAAGSLRHV